MQQVELTQGKVATIDDADFDFLNQFKWCTQRGGGTFYAVRSVKEKGKPGQILMHRVLLNAPNGIDVDHIDGDGLNNTRGNIRLCTKAQNQHNQEKHDGTTSKYKGVCWHKGIKRWVAGIRVDGMLIYLGYFKNEEEAALAYNWGAAKYFGDFARLNELGDIGERA